MRFPLVLAGLLASGVASAAETVDIGVLRNEDINVVQKMMYPTVGRSEIGVHLGYIGFDAYVKSPNLQVSYTQHMSDNLGFSVVAGGGYGFKTEAYRQLESPAYGVAPYAFRYLGSVLAGVEWSPIYAKLNLNGARVVHFDVYGALRAGLTAEQSVLPDASLAFAPTVSPAIGGRFFVGKSSSLHVALRDDLMLQFRNITRSTEFKQNANVTVGFTVLSAVKERG